MEYLIWRRRFEAIWRRRFGFKALSTSCGTENEDLEFKPREENDLELEAKAEAARALKDRETKAATAKPQLAAKPLTGGVGLLDAEAKKKKEETTRQKNNRKQKLGQASDPGTLSNKP